MMVFRSCVIVMCALALAGCAHGDLKAPCGPLPLAYASPPKIPEPFRSMDMQVHECGPARRVNVEGPESSANDGMIKE